MPATGHLLAHDAAMVERSLPPEVPFDGANERATSAAGGAAAVTVTADPDRPVVISQVHFGYDATPAAGALLKIEDVSGTVVFQVPVVAAGPQSIDFVPHRCSALKNSALVVTLTAGGGAILAYVNVNVRRHK